MTCLARHSYSHDVLFFCNAALSKLYIEGWPDAVVLLELRVHEIFSNSHEFLVIDSEL